MTAQRRVDMFSAWARFPDKLAELWEKDAKKTRKRLNSPERNSWHYHNARPPVPQTPPHVARRRLAILKAIKASTQGISRVELKQALGISEDAMRNDIHTLMTAGLIRKERWNRHSYYLPGDGT